jgi:hypothetical protein
MSDAWYEIADAEAVASPALLVFPDRVQENIRRMIGLAGGVDRLRPHVKTHKMREVVALQRAAGIERFKCSTLAEAEMVASCDAADVLLAFPQLGPNLERLRALAAAFPSTRFATVPVRWPGWRLLSMRMDKRSTCCWISTTARTVPASNPAPRQRSYTGNWLRHPAFVPAGCTSTTATSAIPI